MTEWTTILDVKGPHVHSDEPNPERDITSPHTAPQPGNDPSGIAARATLKNAKYPHARHAQVGPKRRNGTRKWDQVARQSLISLGNSD